MIMDVADRVTQLTETGTRVAVAITGSCYVAGLLIVNFDLAQYGVFNLQFLQSQYVLAGVLWAFWVGMTTALLTYCAHKVRDELQKIPAENTGPAKRGRKLSVVTAVIITEGLPLGIMLVGGVWTLGGFQVGFFEADVAALFRTVGIIILNSVAVLALARDLGAVRRGLRGNDVRFISSHAYESSIRIMLVLVMLSLYAKVAYPHFPPAIGGGRKPMVNLVYDKHAEAVISALGLATVPGTSLVEPLKWVFETDDSFILALPRTSPLVGQSVRIKKSAITAVVFERDTALFLAWTAQETATPEKVLGHEPTPTPPPQR
jgi:hypothetical protein